MSDLQGSEQLSASAHLRRVQALLAGGAGGTGGLIDDVEDVALFARIIDAWDDAMTPMTRSEVAERAGLHDDLRFEHRFTVLTRYGALVQHRMKAGTLKWTPNPIALISAEILTRLAEEGETDRLADLIILALDRLEDDDLTADELLGIAEQLTRILNVVAAGINRAVDLGGPSDLIAARPSARAQRQVSRVADIVSIARRRFDAVTHRLRDLVEAADAFGHATDRLVKALVEHVMTAGAAGLFALLRDDDILTAARKAPVDRLARVGRDVVVDAPAPVFTREGIAQTVDDIGAPPPPRPTPPTPPAEGAVDPLADIARHRQAAARRSRTRQRWAQRLLADSDRAVLVEDLWPAPVARLVDAIGLTDDMTVPVVADLSTLLHLDPDSPVAVNTPLRLRRLDQPARDRMDGQRAGSEVQGRTTEEVVDGR
jgi:hypothetical protein